MADKPSARRKVRVTFLEPMRALDPSPEELATRVVEPLINCEPVIPPAIRDIITNAAAAVGALEPAARAAAIAEFNRIAG